MVMGTISIRLAGDLNDFLRPNQRHHILPLCLDRRTSVKDLIESLGVPHPEVGRILVGTNPVEFTYLVRDGDAIELFPRDNWIGEAAEQDEPQAGFRFLLDVHLGRLARNLRLLGLDADYHNDWDDAELARRSDRDQRILLTRDRQLLKRGCVDRGYWVRSQDPLTQTREILDRFRLRDRLRPEIRPWSRCLACNGELLAVDKETVLHLLEPKTRLYYQRFRRCRDCERIYWEGSHCRTLQQIVSALHEAR
jgi:uncharacterized protein with PIN domain